MAGYTSGQSEESHKLLRKLREFESPPRNHFSMRYYILTSGSPLGRHFDPSFSNIPKSRAVVVINTLNKDAEKLAAKWCKDRGIEYHITESNGTPAKGKNSVLDIFLKSDDEYMVQIDGDDFLTPHGVWMYDYLSKMESPPDAVCLKNQVSISSFFGKPIIWRVSPKKSIRTRVSLFFRLDDTTLQHTPTKERLIKWGIDKDYAELVDAWYKEYYKLQSKYAEDKEAHCRVTFLSRKAAEKHRFLEHMTVGEDTIFYFMLKHDGLIGELDVRCNDDIPPTYIYDQSVEGVVRKEMNGCFNWNWMNLYNQEARKLEAKGFLHEKDLPLLKIEYPENYKANSFGLFSGDEKPNNAK